MTKATTKQVTINEIRIKGKLDTENSDDIDTGEENGSGELLVRAAGARQSGKEVVFSGVQIDATSSQTSSHGYGDWSESGLIDEASRMLRKDYMK